MYHSIIYYLVKLYYLTKLELSNEVDPFLWETTTNIMYSKCTYTAADLVSNKTYVQHFPITEFYFLKLVVILI